MTLWLAAVGLVTLLGQVVLLRELLVASFGSELIYLLALGVLLLGTAVGVLSGRRWERPTGAHVRLLFLAFGAALPALAALSRALRLLLGGTSGAYLSFPEQILAAVAVLLPLGLLGGLLFQRAAGLAAASGWTLAAAYGVESLGSLAGGALAAGLLARGVQNLASGLLCALVAVTAASLPWRRERPRWTAPAAGVLGLALAAGLAASGPLDRRLTALDHPDLEAVRDTPYGRGVVTRRLGQVAVFVSGALAYESQGTGGEEFVHVAALEVPEVRSVLMLGGAVEGLAAEVLKHRPGSVTDVELDGALLELARPRLPPESQAALFAPAVTVVVADPRLYLRRPDRYDLIIAAMPEPDSGLANRYYTREFFEACRRRLAPGGVVAFRLRGAENLWTPALARRAASIDRALRAVFSDVLVLPGDTNVFLASSSPLVRDPAVLIDRLEARGVRARLVGPAYLRYLYTNDRVAQIAGILAKTPAPPNTDSRPICYQYTLLLWLSRFFPLAGLMDLPGAGAARVPWALGALAATALLFLASRRSERARRALLVAVAGFLGMVLEGALILGYQVRRGALYQDLGLLLMLFMAGLAAGSLALDRMARRSPRGLSRAHGAGLAAATALLSLSAALVFRHGAGLGGTGLLLFASGLLVGGLFAYVSLRGRERQSELVAPLYAADLAGGALGSLLGSLVLLPALGLPGAAVAMAGLALAACLLV